MGFGMGPGRGPIKPPGPPGSTSDRIASLVIPQLLGRVNSAGTSNTSDVIVAKVRNPSSRLRCIIEGIFQPDAGVAVNSYTAPSWILRAMRGAADGYREVELHTIESGLALPRAYELDSAVSLVQVTATITIPTDVAAAVITGNWSLIARWEANQPLCEADLLALYAMCGCEVVTKQVIPLAP